MFSGSSFFALLLWLVLEWLKVTALKQLGVVRIQTDSRRYVGVGLNLFSQKVNCRHRQMTQAADVELLMCCFHCAAGEDQVLHSALSATDLSRLARSGSVPVQSAMWYPVLQQPAAGNQRNLSTRDWKMRIQSLTECFGITLLVESDQSREAGTSEQTWAKASPLAKQRQQQILKGRFPIKPNTLLFIYGLSVAAMFANQSTAQLKPAENPALV